MQTRKGKELVKTIKEVLEALSNCKYYGTCDKCPYSGDELPTCVFKMKSDAIHAINGLLAENQSLHEALDMYGGDEGISEVFEERDRLADENRALEAELRVNLGNPYWMNICKMNARQESKGMEKYGEPLEENTTLTTTQRIEHLQEELIDALKYCEHLKVVSNDGITANDYQRAAMRTDNKNQTEEERMLDALFGLCGEAGEVMDAYKKYRFQGHESYRDEMIIECSDLLWYAAKLADVLGVTLGEVMERNIEKLKKRFPDGFSKERSVNRDKD